MTNLRRGRAVAGDTRPRNPASSQTDVHQSFGKTSTLTTRDAALALNSLRQVGEHIDALDRRVVAGPARALEQGCRASESKAVLTSRPRRSNCLLAWEKPLGADARWSLRNEMSESVGGNSRKDG